MRKLVLTSTLLVAAIAIFGASSASAGPKKAPKVTWARCWPPTLCVDRTTVKVGDTVRIAGKRLRNGMKVVFNVYGAKKRRRTAVAKLKVAGRLQVKVPKGAKSGRIQVRIGSFRSNVVGPIKVVAPVPIGGTEQAKQAPTTSTPSGSPFDGNGMWIWYVKKSSGGDVAAILAKAKAAKIGTVFIKSGDGTSYWDQFTPSLVAALKAGGLKVCAWQYVYGKSPSSEADVTKQAVDAGADCFVIDAETEYEGHYAAASTYMKRLRQLVGPDYPLGLSTFPYVDYHPSFPYSVFMGPNGAQYNLPQMYWKTIGVSVDQVYSHSYIHNRPYKRPIFPLGQLWQSPSASEINRFRAEAVAYGATGVSWWDWQEASEGGWSALAGELDSLGSFVPDDSYPTLAKGSKSDLVVWAQLHLKAAGQTVSVDGSYGSGTKTAVTAFQAAQGLPQNGTIDTVTWQALLKLEPAEKDWSQATTARVARRNLRGSAPKSASLPAKRYEIPRKNK